MSDSNEETIPVDDLVKPGYYERLVLEIDRRDPDLMTLAVVSRTLISHSIDTVDLANLHEELSSADATNGNTKRVNRNGNTRNGKIQKDGNPFSEGKSENVHTGDHAAGRKRRLTRKAITSNDERDHEFEQDRRHW
ncbi:hypothetical protein BDW62DRAFT_206995 [Aspergillus aurantiobrunneus]